MKHSSDRILTSHAGALAKPDALIELGALDIRARLRGQSGQETRNPAANPAELDRRLRAAVAEVVARQAAAGIDIVNDGEFGKPNFYTYAFERISGFSVIPEKVNRPVAKEWKLFPEFWNEQPYAKRQPAQLGDGSLACTGPILYTGHVALAKDLDNLKAALVTAQVTDAFYPSLAPSFIEKMFPNRYYKRTEDFLLAIGEALREEYEAIAAAGFILQIDNPDLADNWDWFDFSDTAAYLKFARLRAEVLNHALRNVPAEQIRHHVCWGSWFGPHKTDIPLREIAEVLLSVKATCISLEAACAGHDADWHVWENIKLPDGKILMPGVITHKTASIEAPQLVADRLINYAKVAGRENVIAGTDCGMVRTIYPSITWAKFEAMVEGARLATKALWR